MGLHVGGGTDAHRVMSYNPFMSLQWMLDGKTVGGIAMRARDCRRRLAVLPGQAT
jgi:predicted amidohydrolase YtcJ